MMALLRHLRHADQATVNAPRRGRPGRCLGVLAAAAAPIFALLPVVLLSTGRRPPPPPPGRG